jgi:phospholipid/cholesterol/gamma-HCH transport system substrate-binding protein
MLRREVKVGAFVFAGLFVVGLVIFLIGEERQLFSSKKEYTASFREVQGLKRGSPVRMGGVDIGAVSAVEYDKDPKRSNVIVSLSIVDVHFERIRQDSVARIDNKGLLGDKMVIISVGSSKLDQITPGGRIKSEESPDISAMMSKLGTIGDRVERVTINLEKTTNMLASEELQTDVRSGVSSLSNILRSLDQGDGYAARLLNDPKEAEHLSNTLQNLERASAELTTLIGTVNSVAGRVEKGPGFAHEVIYGEDGSKALAQFGGAAEELSKTLRGIREGDGLARSVLFGGEGDSKELISNLNEMSEDLKHIVADVRAGKGTVGALLVDPSVYEDLKLLLGNVQRNKALRALVRYSIKKDEGTASVSVKIADPEDSTAPDPAPPGGEARVGAQAE